MKKAKNSKELIDNDIDKARDDDFRKIMDICKEVNQKMVSNVEDETKFDDELIWRGYVEFGNRVLTRIVQEVPRFRLVAAKNLLQSNANWHQAFVIMKHCKLFSKQAWERFLECPSCEFDPEFYYRKNAIYKIINKIPVVRELAIEQLLTYKMENHHLMLIMRYHKKYRQQAWELFTETYSGFRELEYVIEHVESLRQGAIWLAWQERNGKCRDLNIVTLLKYSDDDRRKVIWQEFRSQFCSKTRELDRIIRELPELKKEAKEFKKRLV